MFRRTTLSILQDAQKRFRRDQRGATIVEFALLALPFFTIIAGILQTSVIFLTGQVLESAVHDATRAIRTGQVQTTATIDSFRSDVCSRTYGLIPDCEGLHVRVTEVTDFASAGVSIPVDMTCTEECGWSASQMFSAGAGKSVMLVQVYFKYPVAIQLGPFGLANLPDGKRLMGSATVFKNEPYT